MGCHIHVALKSHSPCQVQPCGKPQQRLAWHFEDYCFGAFEPGQNCQVDGQRERLRASWLVRELGGKTSSTFYQHKITSLSDETEKEVAQVILFLSLLPADLPFLCVGHGPRLVLTPSFQWMIPLSASLHPWHLSSTHPLHHVSFPSIFSHFHLLKLFSNVSISVPPTPITIPSLSPFWIAIVASWLSFCFSFCPNSPTHFL